MIEINEKIISSDLLEGRVNRSLSGKNIPKDMFGESSYKIDSEKNDYELIMLMQSTLANIQTMNSTWLLSEREATSSKRYIGKLVVFVKKVIRKLTRWLLRPIYEQQSEFNGATTRAVSDMQKMLGQLVEKYNR